MREHALSEANSTSPVPRKPTGFFQVPAVPWPITAEASGSSSIAHPGHPPFQFASTLSVAPYSHQMYPPSSNGSNPSTRAPSPAFSDASHMTHATSSSWGFKRHRLGSRDSRCSDSASVLSHRASFPEYEPGWSKGEQAMFETAIARLTASAGLPLRWVENPEWLALCERFLPSAKIPSRKVLTQRLIPATLKGFKKTAQDRCQGLEGTVSYDGWTGGNHHHYIAFMVNCRGQVSLVRFRSYTKTDQEIGDRTMSFGFMTHRENARQQTISSASWRRLLLT